jgi:DNA-binding NarL/FixJ family response regulator
MDNFFRGDPMTLQLEETNGPDVCGIGLEEVRPRTARRVLLVNDHMLVRMGLTNAISEDPRLVVCGEAGTAAKGVEMYRALRPDVVLMDLRLPDFSGARATAAIRVEFPDARIILISSFSLDEEIHAALEAGARAYVPKSIDAADLRAVVHAVLRGERHVGRELAARLAARNPHSELTGRERDVLELVVRGRRNREIAKELGICEGTVKAHVQTILLKLGVAHRTAAAMVALQRGIVHLS